MASLDGDVDRHDDLAEELQTDLIILWRFERKLEEELKNSGKPV